MSENANVTSLLQEMRRQLAEAHSIAKAAELCARDGWPMRALRICLDIEPLIHDANHLLQAAATMNRTTAPEELNSPGGKDVADPDQTEVT